MKVAFEYETQFESKNVNMNNLTRWKFRILDKQQQQRYKIHQLTPDTGVAKRSPREVSHRSHRPGIESMQPTKLPLPNLEVKIE